MTKYKCPHSHLEHQDVRLPATYTLMGKDPLPVDEQGRIFWHMFDFSDDIEKFHQIGTFANAFSEWQRWLYPWTFVATSDPKKAVWKIRVAKDNKIHYKGKLIKSPYDFDKNQDTIAVQWAYLPDYEWSLTMIINDSFMFDIVAGNNKIWFEGVIKHEIGHGLNIGHTQKEHRDEIMGDRYNPSGIITNDSVNALWAFHGDRLKEDSTKLPMAVRYLHNMGIKVEPFKEPINKDLSAYAGAVILLLIILLVINC